MSEDGLGPFGALLNELLSDDALLKAFLDDPDAVLAKRTLSDAQRQALLHARNSLDIETEFIKENSGSQVEAATGFVQVEAATGFVRVEAATGFVRDTAYAASAPTPLTGFVRACDIVNRLDAATERENE